jgi:hypothetical protein
MRNLPEGVDGMAKVVSIFALANDYIAAKGHQKGRTQMDVFTENHLIAASNLAGIRNAKVQWGRALVRTDINDVELSFLARSFRGCVERENRAKMEYRNAAGILRAMNRRAA